jgi:hypothetical protein
LPYRTVSDDDKLTPNEEPYFVPHAEEDVDSFVRNQATEANEQWLL